MILEITTHTYISNSESRYASLFAKYASLLSRETYSATNASVRLPFFFLGADRLTGLDGTAGLVFGAERLAGLAGTSGLVLVFDAERLAGFGGTVGLVFGLLLLGGTGGGAGFAGLGVL